MKKYFVSIIAFTPLLFVPQAAFAASCGPIRDFSSAVCFFLDIISTLIPIVASIALLVFFWGLAEFIRKSADPGAREEGREIMKWGIVSLFVLMSVWGIVFFLSNDIFGRYSIGIPSLPTQSR